MPELASSAPAAPIDGPRFRRLAWGLLTATFLALVASAWMHEDAYITFRVVDNFLDGRGLVWNPGERVQAYTHPLWLFVVSSLVALTGEYYFTVLALAGGLSLLTAYLVAFRLAPTAAVGCAALLTLLLSKAFTDYATSGLEDPLTRLLLVLFVLQLVRTDDPGSQGKAHPTRGLAGLALLAALATLNRPDALLLSLPALLFRLIPAQKGARAGVRPWLRRLCAMALGFLPLALWGLFAFFYYGFPFPNTAYAKLGLGFPRSWLLEQGGYYLLNSLLRDPVTLGVTLAAIGLALLRPHRLATPLVAGSASYLAYVVWIGGDYMSGRLLAAPFFLAVLALTFYPVERWIRRRPRGALLVTFLLLAPRIYGPALFREGTRFDPHAIGDERRLFYPFTGLLPGFGEDYWPDHYFRLRGERARQGSPVQTAKVVGLTGFAAGPAVHLVDRHGLTDPLLARLPAIALGSKADRKGETWRPGHGLRPVPEGYLTTLETGVNRIRDPRLARYYEALRTVTRGDLWDPERWCTALELNLGRYDSLRDAYVEDHPRLFRPSEPPSPRTNGDGPAGG